MRPMRKSQPILVALLLASLCAGCAGVLRPPDCDPLTIDQVARSGGKSGIVIMSTPTDFGGARACYVNPNDVAAANKQESDSLARAYAASLEPENEADQERESAAAKLLGPALAKQLAYAADKEAEAGQICGIDAAGAQCAAANAAPRQPGRNARNITGD